MDSKKPEELSIRSLLVFNLIGLALLTLFGWNAGCFKSKPTPKPNLELVAAMDELDRKLKDPRVSACFQAAFEMGKTFREEGQLKPSDAELHAIGMKACEHFKVPREMRGVAIDKFKSGFGWGWSSTR